MPPPAASCSPHQSRRAMPAMPPARSVARRGAASGFWVLCCFRSDSSCACLLILSFAYRLPQKAGRERPLSPGRKSPADRFAPFSSIQWVRKPPLQLWQVYLLLSPAEEGNLKHDQSMMNADGSGLRNLTRHAGSDMSPSWSPDGRQIVFQTDRDDNQEISVMNADGSGLRNL